MVEQEIKALCELYTEMTKRYRDIKTNGIDEEIQMEQALTEDIKLYLMELLHILPKSIRIECNDRLVIWFLKKEFYDTADGERKQADIILIKDKQTSDRYMTLDEQYEYLKTYSLDVKPTCLDMRTLNYLCADWKSIKQELYTRITEELDEFIKSSLSRIKGKEVALQNLMDWEV